MSAMSLGTGTGGDVGAAPGAPAAQELENAVRESDGGTLPKGWPARYRTVIAAVLGTLGPDEHIRAAWRSRTLGPAQSAVGVGLLVVTDRQVIGADASSDGGGLFAVPGRAVAEIEVTIHRVGKTDLGGAIRLRGTDAELLGNPEHPAEVQIFDPQREPSAWNVHVRSEDGLAEVEQRLRTLLPSAVAATPPTSSPSPQPQRPPLGAPLPSPSALPEPTQAPLGKNVHCDICGNERPVARMVTVYTAILRRSSRRTSGAYKEYETRTELSDVEERTYDVCAACERKDTRTMMMLLAPALAIALVLLVLWLVQGIAGWWFLVLLVPAILAAAFLYSFVDLEKRLVAQAVESRRPGLDVDGAGRPALHAGWVDSEGRPIQTTSSLVGYTESQYRTVRKQMQRG